MKRNLKEFKSVLKEVKPDFKGMRSNLQQGPKEVFNTFAGKKGWRAALGAYATAGVVGIGVGVAVVNPLVALGLIPLAGFNGYAARNAVKEYNNQNRPKL